jgi:hypothetical protein
VRRLHDVGESGRDIFAPVIGMKTDIYVLLDSGPDNEYGPNPMSVTIPTETSARKCRFWHALIGISGCVLAIWNLWHIYNWLGFLAHTTSAKYVLYILWACIGYICVFLYFLLDGKGEKYIRLATGIALVMIILGMLDNIDKLRYEPQLLLCISGLFLALIYLFDSSKHHIEKPVVLTLVSYILLLVFYP